MEKGFTLIKLVVMLVIFALLAVGGLKANQRLGQMRMIKTIALFNQFDTAVTEFRSKYGQLPGDFSRANAMGIDKPCAMCPINSRPTMLSQIKGKNDGNGDGRLKDSGNGYFTFSGEIRNFWIHLANTNLIPGEYSYNFFRSVRDILVPSAYAAMPSGKVGMAFPSAPVGTGMIALTDSEMLFYVLGVDKIVGPNLGPEGRSAIGDTLTPTQAYEIDSKLDDGVPNAGIIKVIGGYDGYKGKFTDDTTIGKRECYSNDGTYSLNYKKRACTLRVRAFQFKNN